MVIKQFNDSLFSTSKENHNCTVLGSGMLDAMTDGGNSASLPSNRTVNRRLNLGGENIEGDTPTMLLL